MFFFRSFFEFFVGIWNVIDDGIGDAGDIGIVGESCDVEVDVKEPNPNDPGVSCCHKCKRTLRER